MYTEYVLETLHVQVTLRNLAPGQTDPNNLQFTQLSADESGLEIILVHDLTLRVI